MRWRVGFLFCPETSCSEHFYFSLEYLNEVQRKVGFRPETLQIKSELNALDVQKVRKN
jgi:hypothetical protein